MTPLNDKDRDTSKRVHHFFVRMVADNTKRDFVDGPYCYAGDDGKSEKLNDFLGGQDPRT